MSLEYIDRKYKPNKSELIAEYSLEPNDIPIEKAAGYIAAESSIGTWTELSTMNEKIANTLKPHVFSIKNNTVKIAYPIDLFEKGNMPQILSSVAGNIFGMKLVKT